MLRPQVGVITNVALDHTDILGDTVEEIARDKAGIAKPGIPLVSDARGSARRDDRGGLRRRRRAVRLGRRHGATIEPRSGQRYGQSFAVVTPEDRYELALPMLGDFQQENAATAIRALEQLGPGAAPDARGDRDRLRAPADPRAGWSSSPRTRASCSTSRTTPTRPPTSPTRWRRRSPTGASSFVMAIGESKDAAEVIRPFLALRGTFTFTTFSVAGRNAMRPQRLASIADSLGGWGRAIGDPVDAFSIARRNAEADDVIVVTGSTFVVAELREWWMANVMASGV